MMIRDWLHIADMHQSEVVVFGAAHVDLEAHLDGPLNKGASNPVKVRRTLGGVGANVAMASCRSATTTLCTITGTDADGHAIVKTLRDAGVFVDILLSPVNSGFYLALLDNKGNLQHGLANTATMELAEREQVSASLGRCRQARVIAFDCNLSTETITAICNHPFADSARPLLAAVTVSPIKTPRLRQVVGNLDLIFSNREELAVLTDASIDLPLKELAERTHAMGVKTVIATDSNQPLVTVSESASLSIEIPAKPDSTSRSVNGAGDTLAGAVMAELAKGTDVITAIPLFQTLCNHPYHQICRLSSTAMYCSSCATAEPW